MFNVIETQIGGAVVVHVENVAAEDVKRIVYNVGRRAAVTGVVSAVEVEIESDFVNADGYISFSDAAKFLGVRYQQVFQRAVTKGKMSWRQSPENEVAMADVLVWKEKRSA